MPNQANAESSDPSARLSSGRVLTLGVGVAVALWVVWFALHLPGLRLPPGVVGPVVLGAWVILAAAGSRLYRPGLAEGALGGLVTAAMCLLALGSMLVEQPDPAAYTEGAVPLRPAAALIAGGFLLAGLVIGTIGAYVGGRGAAGGRAPATALDPWPGRLAAVVALSYVPLVLLGGVVTSTESGLAVRGWPDTFGANMFLYPISLMSQPRVFFEHSHRLFGTLAGLATLLLWVATLLNARTRARFGPWTTLLFVAICIQGYLGGQRVVLNNPYLGAIHGAAGQVLLAFAGLLALWMSPAYREVPALAAAPTRNLLRLNAVAVGAALVQLLLGALYRHLRRDDEAGAMHVVLTHAAFSFAVVALAVIGGALLIRFGKQHRDALPPGLARRLRLHGVAAHATVGLQFVLGWFTLLAVLTGEERGPVPTAEQVAEAAPVPLAEAILATLHQANGALFLVVVVLAWAWARRVYRAAAA